MSRVALKFSKLGSVLTNHSQEHFLSISRRICKFECDTVSDWLNYMVYPIRSCITSKFYGSANQKLCYVQMLLNIEKSGV